MNLQQFLQKVVKAFVTFALAFVGVGVFLPSTFRVERTIEIAASPDLVYNFVSDVTLIPYWDPWIGADPATRVTPGPVTRGTGASLAFTSQTSPPGRILILASAPDASVSTELSFDGLGASQSLFVLATTEDGGTRVSWEFSDEAGFNLLSRYMYAFAMERMISPHLESGLARLKQVVEAGAAAEHSPPGSLPPSTSPPSTSPSSEGSVAEPVVPTTAVDGSALPSAAAGAGATAGSGSPR